MKYRLSLFLLVCSVCAFPQAPTGLLCNLLSHPELSVITDKQPAFGWIVPGDKQTAYRILVASSEEVSLRQEGDIWDSGKITSSQSVNLPYTGPALQAVRTYWWQVQLWGTGKTPSAFSHIQRFNTGDWDKARAWPGESNWVQVPLKDGTTQWTFENRHPISYHTIYPVRTSIREGVYFFDFGKAAFSNAGFSITSPEDKEVVVRIGEKAIGDRIDSEPGGGVIYQEYPLFLKQGTHDYTLDVPRFVPRYPHSQAMPAHMPEVIPFRYIEIVATGIPIEVRHVTQRALYYQFNDQAASFVSSDSVLNAIYELCRYSVKANTFNGDYAASQRERMMYEADCYIHQMSHYATDREYAIARYSLENMIYHATWPAEWIMHIPLMAWADYLHTGDLSFIEQYYEQIKPKTLLALSSGNGLISTLENKPTEELFAAIHFNGKELRDIVDWPQGNKTSTLKGGETDDYDFRTFNTVVNAFHYHSLVLMGRMAEALGKKADRAFYHNKAVQVKDSFNRHFLNPASGIYVDGVGSTHSSLHANMFALVFGLVPDASVPPVVSHIKNRGMACGVYGANYLLEALYDAGEAEYALALLTSDCDRSWVNMLRVGATMTTEAWDNKYKSNNGWSHAWSASPAHIIPRKLMGIEPLEPGFGKIRIKPQPASIRTAEVKLPSIRGDIKASFDHVPGQRFVMTVDIPANTIAEVWMPDFSGTHKVAVNNVVQKGGVDGSYIKVVVKAGKHVLETSL